ncbi:hypothetical protein Bca4012_041627 [Brassica carinata]|uniref:Uncharacterized protein n=1 Tax=Brassica carinata TaxID=52824 RepID=A0A8X7UJC4_BRACI|nr:hypothetical protein Bca52824_060601 [Brassica carinata]
MPTFSAAVFDTTLKDHQQTKAKIFSCLYATPKEIPLPYSPYSSPPSPYIVNLKARRPTPLLKSSFDDVEATTTSSTYSEDDTNGVLGRPVWDSTPPQGNFWGKKSASHKSNGDIGSADDDNCLACESYLLESVRTKANKDHVPEYFYDRGQSVSFTSNSDVRDDARADNSHNRSSSGGEFYDARDELSTDSGTPSSVNNVEAELRLSLLMESEKRRQAEETLEEMQVQWRRLRQQLAHVGLFLPLDPTSTQYSMNIADELRCQLEFTRFVSDSLDIELAKAEVEMEMTSELEAKKFEISQLSNRLHYSETVNQEMSQRNQEAIEDARREKKKKRKRRQRWIWGSIAVSITLGGAVLAYPTANSLTDVAQTRPSPIK